MSVSKDGDITDDYLYVRDRNPLHVIRQNLYKYHKPYYCIQSDSEKEMTAEDIIKYEYEYQGDNVDVISLKNKFKYF